MTTGRRARQPTDGITNTGETLPPSGMSLRARAVAPPTGGTLLTVAAPTGDVPTGVMMVGDGGGDGGVMMLVAAAAEEGVSPCCRQ